MQKVLIEQAVKLARGLNVVGLMNIQFAIQNDVVYLLEVNPRASRTVPFVSKAVGMPLAKIAARAMVGESLGTRASSTSGARLTTPSRRRCSRSSSSPARTRSSARR